MGESAFRFDVAPTYRYNVTASSAEVLGSPGSFYGAGDIAWMTVSSALVLLMIPGVGLLYSGMSRSTSMSMVWMPMCTAIVVLFVWFLWGYAIAFSPSSNMFWGGTSGIAFYGAVIRPVGNPHGPQIPELLYALFQGMFACFTAALLSGATIFKERTHKFLIFIVFWTTLVYSPIAHWSWNPQGWSNKWGTYDFAGGTPVHICSGASAAAYGLFYKFRLRSHNSQQQRGEDRIPEEPFTTTRGYNAVSVVTGTAMIWIGWFGFNGGSALGANLRAVSACVSTSLAACSGGITAYSMEMLYASIRKAAPKPEDLLMTEADWLGNLVEVVCAGAVVGMVGVTPAAGYIPFYWAPIFGLVCQFICYYTQRAYKKLFDPLNIFSIHCVAGFFGMLLTGFLARADVVALDGYSQIPGGCNLHDKHCSQLYKQLVDALAGVAYSFFGTLIILIAMETVELCWGRIRGLTPRAPELVVDIELPDR